MLGFSSSVHKWDHEASLIWQPSGHEFFFNIFEPWLRLSPEDLKALIGNVLTQGGFICDDICCWGRFNKSKYGVKNIAIGFGYIMEGTGTDNQVVTSHGLLSVPYIIVVDVGRMP